ncbi:MAG: glycosyltransferase [bacterium]
MEQISEASNKRIVILIPSLLGGGTERAVSIISNELVKHNIEVHLLTLEQGSAYKVNDFIIDTLSSWHGSKNFSRKKYFYIPAQLYRFIRHLRKNRIKIVLSFQQRANLINIASKILYPHTAITNVRTTISKAYSRNNYLSKIKYNINKLLAFSNIILCNSKGIRNDLIESFNLKADKIKVINNPYNIESIKSLSEESLETEHKEIFNSPVIINVGRFMTPKGQWHLLRAFKKVKAEIKDVKLVMLGEGWFEQYLRQLIKDLDLENSVYLLGFQKNPFKFVSKASIFVLSSLWEGFPNVIVEAMICGTPVISTDCRSGPREILAPNTDPLYETTTIEYASYGVLVPVMDQTMYKAEDPLTLEESLFADAMIKLLKDEDMRHTYSVKGRKRAEDFKSDKIIKEYLDIILSE